MFQCGGGHETVASFDSIPAAVTIQQPQPVGFLADIEELAVYLGVPQIQIEEVLSFYTQFRRKPIGRWHLQFCHNISCSMNGAENILAHVERRLGIRPAKSVAPPASPSRPAPRWPRRCR